MKKKLILLAVTASLLGACTPAEKPPENPPEKQPENVIRHEIGETSDTYNSHPKVYAETTFDFDYDLQADTVKLITSEIIEDGEVMTDDGQHWQLTVETAGGTYLLYDKYIQLGNAELDIGELYNDTPESLIILTLTTGAGKSIIHYTFRDGVFYEELVYSSDNYSEGGVNIVQSIPCGIK